MMKQFMIFISVALLIVGCTANAPPMYENEARKFLRDQGVEADLIKKITSYNDILTDSEVERLQYYENVAVKHLLGRNLGTPPELLAALAKHPNFEVRTGVASNPKTPLPVLLSLRVKGRYDTVNTALATNPMLPQSVLREMYNAKEGLEDRLAENPNLPEDLMRAIDKHANFLNMNRTYLASNPKLPRDLLDKYLADKDEVVRAHARSNPQINPDYRNPRYDMLGGP